MEMGLRAVGDDRGIEEAFPENGQPVCAGEDGAGPSPFVDIP